jgi:hypothetical protein
MNTPEVLQQLVTANQAAIDQALTLPVHDQVRALKVISNNIDEQLKIVRNLNNPAPVSGQ